MADTDLSGTVLDGRYKVIEPIAEGAMGSVYRAERVGLGRAVAIKVMHQELPDELASRQRFEREAKLMALLEHPNCVSVNDFGLHDDKPFLVMDLVRGTSLLDVLEKSGQLDVARASDIIRQVLSGLAHAHELGIVHRDIKPANIMITEKAGLGLQVRILDFGLARLTEGSTKLTTGIVVGTPNYMAPEQCKGGDIDARTDLYACGVMLFEMLTGRKPFLAEDPIQVVRKHLLEAPPTMASVDPKVEFGDLEAVVARALSKAAKDRFDSAVDMSKAVEAAAAKHAKAIYARAVPQTAPPPMGQLATMSGWSVPGSDGGSADSAQHAAAPSAAPPPPPPPPAAPAFARPATAPPTAPPAPPNDASSDVGFAATSLVLESAPINTGIPNQSLAVPPTRPSTTGPRSAIPELPFTKKQGLIGAGVLVGVIVIIAIVASSGGGSSKKKDTKQGSGTNMPVFVPDVPKEDAAPIIEHANQLIAADDIEDAIKLLTKARKANPDNPQLALVLGKAYFAKLWWTEGLKNFRDAIRLDPELRSDSELLKTVLRGFLTTSDIDGRIADFMRNDVPEQMKPMLEETASKHTNKQLRARAKAELRNYK